MLDVIIGHHIWNCQIRTHIHTGYTHTRTFKKKVERLEKKRKKSRKNHTKKEGGSGKKERRKRERTKTKGGKRRRKMREKGGGKTKKKKKKRKKEGDGFEGVEERGYGGGQDLIFITLDRHECVSVFHHLQKDKQCKQRHSLKLGKKRRQSSKRNYYIISPRVIIKATIIILTKNSAHQIMRKALPVPASKSMGCLLECNPTS